MKDGLRRCLKGGFYLDDRYDEVLEKYDFSVSKMSRARGAMVLWTDKGIKLLCETHASAGRLVWEKSFEGKWL